MQKKSRNYWPHAIIISLLLVALACVYTVVEAAKYPIEMDTYYFENYKDIDKNYDKIEALQKSFDAKYSVEYEAKIHVGGDNDVAVLLFEKSDANSSSGVDNATVELLVTRPETNQYNQMLSQNASEEGTYLFSPINIEKVGRWQFQTKITIGEDVGFFKHEVNITQ